MIFRAIYNLTPHEYNSSYRHFTVEADSEDQAKDRAISMLADVGQTYEKYEIDIISIDQKDYRVQ